MVRSGSGRGFLFGSGRGFLIGSGRNRNFQPSSGAPYT